MKSLSLVLLPWLLAPLTQAQQAEFPLQFAADLDEVALVGASAFRADTLLVRLDDARDLSAARTLLDSPRFVVEEPLMPSLGLYLVRILDGTRVAAAVHELGAVHGVRYAAPDHLVSSRATVPNDPSFAQQWCHTKMQSTAAWDLGCGSKDFVVSVVDGGCLLTHTDLAANLYTNAAEAAGLPGVDDDGNGYVDDLHGWNAYSNNGNIPNDSHGTHVNGIVGAVGDNATGVVGVNWNVTLMPVAGSSSSTSTVVKAYGYVLAQKQLWLSSGGTNGANVVSTNSSFGIDYGNCGSPAYLPWNDAYDALGSVGILSCAATANLNINIDTAGDVPTGCASAWLVAVTNTQSNDTRNPGAAYGATTIDLGAPGTSVYSTYSNGGYSSLTGTSMASPQVAGAISLLHAHASANFAALRDADPAGAALIVKDTLIENVDTLPDLLGKTVSGGRLNLFKSVTALSAWSAGLWIEVGIGLGGTYGVPSLAGAGTLAPGSTWHLDLTHAARNVPVTLVLGLSQLGAPFKGGTLVPSPDLIVGGLVTNGVGALAISSTWPAGVPSGASLWLQEWIADATGPVGFTATNGVQLTTP
ncbi:MAG: S8 family serine peptidase [Planctomycetes bacterium]|nr:S8 family serine peptidase [Planctomycetota bacterium]